MSTNVVTTTLAAFLCAAVVSAQAPQTPQVPPSPSPSQPAAPAQRAPEAKAAPADSLTVTGCIERSAGGSSATPGSVGTTGAAGAAEAPGFMLTKVMKPTGTAGSSTAAAASTYRLDADDSKLSGHVGHKVEITGTLSNATGAATSNAARLKVETVKMIAATCTE